MLDQPNIQDTLNNIFQIFFTYKDCQDQIFELYKKFEEHGRR